MTHDELLRTPAPAAPAPATGVAALRQCTAARHCALEATPLARALLSPSLSRSGYRQVLAAWASAMAPLEQAVATSPHGAALGALLPAPRHALALADLRALAPATEHASRPGPHPPHAPPAARLRQASATPAGLLGLCYVLRGASLGSQVIARHLRSHLGLDATQGAAYFGSQPADGLSWPRWMAAADARLLDADALAHARLGAEAAFDALLADFAAMPAGVWP